MLPFLMSLIIAGIPLPFAELVRAEEVVWTPEMVKELAIEQAEKYGLHKGRFLKTLECENGFNATGQSNHYYKGVREDSWGAAQYWLPQPLTLEDGTPITKEIAENPALAIPAMAWHFSEGRASRWSCFVLVRDGLYP